MAMTSKILLVAGCLALAHAGIVPAAPYGYAPAGYAPAGYAPVEHASPVIYAAAEHAAPVGYAPAEHAAPAAPVAYAAAPATAYTQTEHVVSPVAYAAAPVAYAAKSLDYDPHPEYKFSYDVQDDLTGDSKSQHESRSGDVVHGSYSLDDPDGTRRTVDYTADDVHGFNAVVRKEAQAPKYVVHAAPVAYAAPHAPHVAYHRK